MIDRRAFLRAGAAGVALAAGPPTVVRAQAASVTFASTTGATGLMTQTIRRLDLERKYDLFHIVRIRGDKTRCPRERLGKGVK